jgi:hypothetical protein
VIAASDQEALVACVLWRLDALEDGAEREHVTRVQVWAEIASMDRYERAGAIAVGRDVLAMREAVLA